MTKRVGLIVGREWSFPPAFIEEVNGRNAGVVAEYVRIAGPMTYDFEVKRSSSYVALHEFKRLDGETFIDGSHRSELKDLRNKITFVPYDCGVNGWTRIASDAFFTAVYFDGPAGSQVPE